jgi:hypothetical protein
MTSVLLLQPKAFWLLLGWKGLEVQLARLGSFPPMVLGAEEEESPVEANEDKIALETLSKSSSLLSSSSSSSPLSQSPSLPSKEKGNLHPPHLLWKCQCNAWVLVSLSSSLSSLLPSSEDESKGRSVGL